MKLDPSEWRTLEDLLERALDLPEPARTSWLDNLSGSEATFGPLVRDLLAQRANAATGDFIDTLPPFGPLAGENRDLAAGTLIGPYRLLRELGRGGMGEVWLAERADGLLRRPIALKLPLLALRRSALAERFAREREILAPLSHAHIARLYDAGFAGDGQPYLALEYVDGVPLTRYADVHRLDVAARLALFDQVLDAVAHAHANLVLHRDLKPSNILVTPQGDVKLLDFGIAKLMREGEAAETQLTQAAGCALTPDYASPEQIAGETITTASDVYSLGVVLYELLCGVRPYQLKRGSRDALEDAIVSMEPVKPSQSSITAEIAHARSTTVKRLRHALAGDLDTVVSKALKKPPAGRYATANAVAQDLQRFRAGEPVLALPDSAAYRIRKFVARNRGGVAVASSIAATLVAATAFSLLQAQAARDQALVAQREAARAQAVQDFLLDIFRTNSDLQVDPIKARQTTARELLDIGAQRISSRLKDAPAVKAEVSDTLADMYLQVGLDDEAADMEWEQIKALKEIHGPRDLRVADALLNYAGTLFPTNRRDQGAAALREAKAIVDASPDASPVRGRMLVESARFQMYESIVDMRRDAEEAVRFYRQHYASDGMLTTALRLAGRARFWMGDYIGSEAAYREAIGPDGQQRDVATFITNLVELAEAQAKRVEIGEAEASLRLALLQARTRNGELHVDTLHVETRLGAFLHATSRRAEGRELLASALHKLGQGPGTNTPNVIDPVRRNYAAALLADGRIEEAGELIAEDVKSLRTRYTRALPLANTLRTLAAWYVAIGRYRDAQVALDEAFAMWKAIGGNAADPATDNPYLLDQAALRIARGEPAAAIEILHQITPPKDGARLSLRVDETLARIDSSQAFLKLDRVSEAEDAARQALADIVGSPVRDYFQNLEADAALRLGQAQLRAGDPHAALGNLNRAVDLRKANDDPVQSLWLAEAEVALADCLLDLGLRDQARAALRQASAIHASHRELADHFRAPLTRVAARMVTRVAAH